jgi:hypothetical protein
MLVESFAESFPGEAIVNQEKRGQGLLVQSSLIPTELLWGPDPDGLLTEERLVELGFTLGAILEDDPLFREAELPKGWTRVATDHDMWSKILDETGTERMTIFYKAAFYDRGAHMSEVKVKE